MCGIAGRLEFEPGQRADPSLVQRMCDAIAHRGPDDAGVWSHGPVALGHRRLSIIDLSPAGHQPMASADGALWIVFNGEIYNFQELRAELEREGHVFRSRTDTEVILHLYQRDGVACVRRLRGMFAFALWDEREQQLLLARDRVGKKPLAYHADARGITFASEIKAVLQDPEVGRELDPAALHHYLTFQCVPAPLCAFQSVRKLPPGHILVARRGRIRIERYWKLEYQPKLQARTAREERSLEAELLERLEHATALRLVSDVPIGAFLSGGVDSAAVVAMMCRRATGQVRTFSIGFDDGDYDEMAFARETARHFGTAHTEFRVRPSALEVLPKLVWHYDEPFADASAIPTYYVAKMAREHVTVVLNGDGGDESFAGYDRYVADALARRLGPLGPVLGSATVRALVDLLPHGATSASARWRLKRFLAPLGLAPQVRNAAWQAQFDPEAKQSLYTAAFRREVGAGDAEEMLYARYREAGTADFLDAMLYTDVNGYLPDTLLAKVDIATMAVALEARSPFLDHELMEWAARLPARLKLRGRTTKVILKRALRGIVPPSVLERRKMGFNVPVDRWLRGELRELSHDLLLSRRSLERGYFQREFIQRMLREHALGTRNWHTQIWNLMMLESWHRRFVDEDQAQGVAV
jgi:asparagine synthase (glutamine-hydrolysing)